MRSHKTVTAVLVAASLLAFSASAVADTVHVDDPSGDGQKGRALDITKLTVSNRDRAVVTEVEFVRASVGDLAIYYLARGDKRNDVARVVSRHRAGGDKNVFETVNGLQPCKGLSVTWDHDAETVRVRFPSRCFRDGDYGAVHARAITEMGSDADYAPKDSTDHWRWTPWVRRG